MSCCNDKNTHTEHDYLFLISLSIVIFGYVSYILGSDFNIKPLKVFNTTIFEIFNKMWWGIILGIFFVGVIELIPKQSVSKILGNGDGIKGIMKAALAGILFDLCSHGILLIAMKLYKQGTSLPQVMAFLIASPWNSISLTIILFALIGFKWTAIFILFSFLVAVASGVIFQYLIKNNFLPENPYILKQITDIGHIEAFSKKHQETVFNLSFFLNLFKSSFIESKSILRWVFFGVIIAGLIRTFMPDEMFIHYFGASILGIFMTLIATTIIEVCSEGSVPIAADILQRAAAPGNAFVFLMAGVATDYTEIMALKETTGSRKISLFLPLVTVPQILLIGYLMNFM